MRKLVIILSALGSLCAPAIGQSAKPQIIPMNPKYLDGSAIVIPAGSALRVASFPSEGISDVTFSGRLTLTGTYELRGYGDQAWVNLRPDSNSRAILPHLAGLVAGTTQGNRSR